MANDVAKHVCVCVENTHMDVVLSKGGQLHFTRRKLLAQRPICAIMVKPPTLSLGTLALAFSAIGGQRIPRWGVPDASILNTPALSGQ